MVIDMKYILILIATLICSTVVFAENNEQEATKLCADMIMQKQAQIKPARTNITNKQADTYCSCIVPQLQKIQTSEELPSQEALKKLYQTCQTKAGIVLSK